MFYWRADDSDITTVFTSARGGEDDAPYAALNLGGHVGQEPHRVLANRALVAAELGVAPDHLLFVDQVHGREVAVVDRPWGEAPVPAADALVTATPGLAVAVLVADCTPVVLRDESVGVVGVAHAGRPGMVAGVVPATVEAMRDLGARDIRAVVGPSICGRCYEVPEAMRADVAVVAPSAFTWTWSGTPAVDVAGGVMGQLADAGIPATWVPGCTREDDDLYSYRRDGRTGRFAGIGLVREVAR